MQTLRVPYFRVIQCHPHRHINAVTVEQMLHLYAKKCNEGCRDEHQVQQLCWVELSKQEIDNERQLLSDDLEDDF